VVVNGRPEAAGSHLDPGGPLIFGSRSVSMFLLRFASQPGWARHPPELKARQALGPSSEPAFPACSARPHD
jgi:hypothetical protein